MHDLIDSLGELLHDDYAMFVIDRDIRGTKHNANLQLLRSSF